MAKFKGEILKNDLKTKKVYRYIDEENNIDQLSKEEFKNRDLVIHYPIGYEGGEKYQHIKEFHFIDFKKKLPVGINKSYIKGYGFTRILKSLAKYIDQQLKIEKVIIEKNGTIKINKTNNHLFLNESSLKALHQLFVDFFKKNTQETNLILLNSLHDLFPNDILKPPKLYVTNALSVALANWGNKIDEFSTKDKEAIKELFDKLSLDTTFLSSGTLAKTKQLVDNKYITETLKNYSTLMSGVSDGKSLEKKWQKLLKENSWIFSSIFAHPVILFKDEAYVGGKSIDNSNGKFNDFLIKNSLSDNVSFLELKTHKTPLLESSAYRGDDVFSASKDLTGCINQVLNQRDNFQKEFDHLKRKSKKNFETFNSKCVVLIGSLKDLTVEQKYCFELFRSNSRDVEILTFDELQNKIQSLQEIMTTK